MTVKVRMMELLADGRAHTRAELHACLWDTESDVKNVRSHIALLRREIRPQGQDIVCEILNRVTYYRLVRLLASAYDGYR